MSIEVRSGPLSELLAGIAGNALVAATQSEDAHVSREAALVARAASNVRPRRSKKTERVAFESRAKQRFGDALGTCNVYAWEYGRAVSYQSLDLAISVLSRSIEGATVEELLELEKADLYNFRAQVSEGVFTRAPFFAARYFMNDVLVVPSSLDASPVIWGPLALFPHRAAQREVVLLAEAMRVAERLTPEGDFELTPGVSGARLHLEDMIITVWSALARAENGASTYWCS